MSIRLMSQVWDLETESPTEKLVLLALADNASDQGFCWPSLGTICRKSQLCERSVRNVLRSLEERGWLKTNHSNGHSSNYQLLIQSEDPGTRCRTTPARGAPTPAPDAGTPARGAPITVSEPSLNLVKERVKAINEIVQSLGQNIFKRQTKQNPSPEEERAALEVIKRPHYRLEAIQIVGAYQAAEPGEHKFLGGTSLVRLLEDWQQVLDRIQINVNAPKDKAKAFNGHNNTDKIIAHKELERIDAKIKDIRNQGTHYASGVQFTPEQKQQLRTLKDRRELLIKQLGCTA